jgi:hypothetical protein
MLGTATRIFVQDVIYFFKGLFKHEVPIFVFLLGIANLNNIISEYDCRRFQCAKRREKYHTKWLH